MPVPTPQQDGDTSAQPAVAGDNRAELQTALDALAGFDASLAELVTQFTTQLTTATDGIAAKKDQAVLDIQAKKDDAVSSIEMARDTAIRAIQSSVPVLSYPTVNEALIDRNPYTPYSGPK